MKKTLYLSLAIHDSESDQARLKSMAEEAAGNIQKFRDLYRDRFSIPAWLYGEDVVTDQNRDEFIMVGTFDSEEPGQQEPDNIA